MLRRLRNPACGLPPEIRDWWTERLTTFNQEMIPLIRGIQLVTATMQGASPEIGFVFGTCAKAPAKPPVN